MAKEEKHLPVIGIGPLIVAPQLILTGITIWMDKRKLIPSITSPNTLRALLVMIGISMILAGVVLWWSANFKEKIDQNIKSNQLVTSGSYAWVRNPIYSAFWQLCFGIVLMNGNILLCIVPLLNWIYMTILLKNTEEKWLFDLYGKDYELYCKKVNRIIPFPERRS
ncbi:hypothetical protein P261_02473 [Lachnospiraceae bacterium TWA4]|nr:hypothetical protein P261_02473 [Lachnospiraceae bacterium TWA4]